MKLISQPLIFPRAWVNFFLKSYLTSEINSIFNVKTLNFLFNTFSLVFEHVFLSNFRHCMQYMAWCHKHLLFHIVKTTLLIITTCEDIIFFMDKTQYFTAENVTKSVDYLWFLLICQDIYFKNKMCILWNHHCSWRINVQELHESPLLSTYEYRYPRTYNIVY